MRARRKLRTAAYLALAVALLAAVVYLDGVAPPEADFAFFYLLPIGIVAWFCGAGCAYAVSILAAGAWLWADFLSGRQYGHWAIPYWNAAINLCHFVVVVALARLIARLRTLNDREREVSQLKSDLVSLVSHEFCNQLTIMRLSLSALEESEGPEPSAARLQIYARLRRAYAHLKATTENFLNLNRIEAGRFAPHLGKTPLRTLVHAVIAQLGPLVEGANVKLILDFPADHVVVKADPDALSVILHNLLGNAFKYTPAGGEVKVRILVDAKSRTALLGVRDTGIGIPKSDRAKVATGYYRTESGKKRAKGFGVGLKVSTELLESMGARLRIESEPGRGSDFSFRLPLWEETPAAVA